MALEEALTIGDDIKAKVVLRKDTAINLVRCIEIEEVESFYSSSESSHFNFINYF